MPFPEDWFKMCRGY
ncbi:hypothetical protein LPW63_003443 [Salmonella enterica subsp. enterica serovar Enteritidis]|nr:hypothetical protein BTN67_05365 [Salmonella enterica subsp. enterica serovar Enteritidis]EAN3755127.1 hypothetical protein [Salmonella enterica]EEG7321303.1 hypothetical protein [Salmonella enterica subsp. enterica serovar Typhimurium]HAD2079389.1 hypothetical protein [Salmonella enterica subsp. enterica]HAD6736783.1 hypothetical protein [Salmonella enterica subsp. enterica serovar Typhimurium str. SL1344]HCB5530702.1 hypothetical protein [Salmonella enterica subsp. enterica serovar Vinohr